MKSYDLRGLVTDLLKDERIIKEIIEVNSEEIAIKLRTMEEFVITVKQAS